MNQQTAQEWVQHEDLVARPERIERLEWLVANYPSSDLGFMLHGGYLTKQLLEEARYCFVYGQFLATAILGVAFIERVLAAWHYGAGRDDLERSSGMELLREALKNRWISLEEFQQFDRIRRLRNPIIHFRRPHAPETLEFRALHNNLHPYDVLQNDAQEILGSVFQVLRRSAVHHPHTATEGAKPD